MSRCILHIGMHKTGSTSIQSSLKGFKDNAFYYAELSADPNHSLAMYSLFSQHPARHHLHLGKQKADIDRYVAAARKNLAQSIELANGRTLVISGEGISLLPYDNIKAIHQFLAQKFDDIQVVAYVRPPIGYMTSVFQETVKVVANSRFNIEREYKNYQNTFSKFDEIFKPGNVQLWKFDPKAFPEGCVVQDFCLRLGIPLPKQNIVRVNESLCLQAVALIYIYRKFGQSFNAPALKGKDSIQLGEAIKTIGNDRLRCSSEILLPILEHNSQDIQWMEKRLGQSLAEDIGQTLDTDIRNEADLIQAGVNAAPQLLQLTGRPESDFRLTQSLEGVAYLVGQFRQKLADKASDQYKVLAGNIGLVTAKQVDGWAIGINPNVPVRLAIKVNGEMIGEQWAGLSRPGLKERGFHPSGLCGFSFAFAEGDRLKDGDIVTIEPTDASFTLTNSPYTFNNNE